MPDWIDNTNGQEAILNSIGCVANTGFATNQTHKEFNVNVVKPGTPTVGSNCVQTSCGDDCTQVTCEESCGSRCVLKSC